MLTWLGVAGSVVPSVGRGRHAVGGLHERHSSHRMIVLSVPLTMRGEVVHKCGGGRTLNESPLPWAGADVAGRGR